VADKRTDRTLATVREVSIAGFVAGGFVGISCGLTFELSGFIRCLLQYYRQKLLSSAIICYLVR
jgi:ABC-type nitrate/sulfonate/bicarbonate transport system permease component